MGVTEVGTLNLKMHSNTDFIVTLTRAYVTEGTGLNLFSLHQAQAPQTTAMNNYSVLLFDNRLTSPRDWNGQSLYANRTDPTPSTGFTTLPALSGVTLAPPKWVISRPEYGPSRPIPGTILQADIRVLQSGVCREQHCGVFSILWYLVTQMYRQTDYPPQQWFRGRITKAGCFSNMSHQSYEGGVDYLSESTTNTMALAADFTSNST